MGYWTKMLEFNLPNVQEPGLRKTTSDMMQKFIKSPQQNVCFLEAIYLVWKSLHDENRPSKRYSMFVCAEVLV